MANNVNQENIIGSFVPDVYIEKISLETSGAPIDESNPHIDHQRETLNARTQEDSDYLIVKLSLLMKEKLTDDLIGSWFGNQDIGKYLNLSVYQCTNSTLTSILSAGTDAIDIINPDVSLGDNDIRMKIAASALDVDNISEVYEVIERDIKRKKISVKKDVEGSDSSLSQYKSKIDENGNVVYDITYVMQFEIANSQPEHLAYFAASSIDVRTLASDFDLEIGAVASNMTNGKVVSEVIIDDFDVVARSYIFYDENNDIWAGLVHKEEGQWMTGSSRLEGSVALTRTVVSNTKVQDFRNIKEVEKLVIDFSVLEQGAFANNITKRLSNDITVPKPKESFFSDMMLSRDKDGDSKFFFSVDMEKMIIENTLFGRLIKTTPRLKRELIRGTQIRGMRIYRQRIKEDSSLAASGTPIGVSPFDTNEPLELIVNSGESSWKTFSSVNNQIGSLKEVELINSEEFFGIRHFSGMDKTMSEVTDGMYRYVVDVDVDDATVEIIEQKIQNLLLAKSDLLSYYSVCSQASMSKYLAEVRDPHIDSPDEFAGTRGTTAGNYDPASNRFTQLFVEKMSAAYAGKKRLEAPWIAPIAVYVDVLDLFTDYASDRRNRYQLLNALYSFTSPRTGNPSGVAAAIKIIDSLASTLAKLIGTTILTSTKKYSPGSSQRSAERSLSASPKKTFTIRKSFTQVFDSEVIKGIGVDYLSRGEDETENDDSVRVIRGDIYSDRIDMETLRFYKTLQPDVNITVFGDSVTENDSVNATNFTFLTPARFDTAASSVVVLDGTTPTDTSAIKNKKERFVKRVGEGEVAGDDMIFQLYSTMAQQKSSDSPVAAANTVSGDPVKNSKKASLKAMSSLIAGLSVNIDKIKVKVEKDEDESTILTPIQEITLLPEAIMSCQVPDALEVEPTNNRDETEEDSEALLPFYGIIMASSVKSGANDRSKRRLRKTNVSFTKGPQVSSENTRAPFVAVANVNNLKVVKGEINIISGLNKSITEEQFKKFPNQVKAMFLQSAGSSVIKHEKYANINATSMMGRAKAAAEIDLSYEMINKVVFLEDYNRDTDGNLLVREPIWSDLTQEKYDLMVGQGILCYMKPYEDNTISLKKKKGLSSVVYDEYFILTPKKVLTPLPTFPIAIESGVLTNKIVEDIRETLPSMNIVQVNGDAPKIKDVEEESDVNTNPVKIEIIETDSRGVRTEKVYNIGDNSTPVVSTESTKEVTIRGSKIQTNTQLVVELVATDCQASNVETELLQNNLIEGGTVIENVKTAAESEGSMLVMLDSVVAVVSTVQEECTDNISVKNQKIAKSKKRDNK